MPPAFACLTWPPEDAEACADAGRLASALTRAAGPGANSLRQDGLYLIDLSRSRNGQGRILTVRTRTGEQAGYVYGTLFRRQAGRQRALTDIPAATAERICQTQGRHLLTDYWGHYVLFLRTEKGAVCLTDPVGAFPCFYRRMGKLVCLFSHLEACPPDIRRGLPLDIAFLKRLCLYDKIQTGETGFAGLRELGGGQMLDLDRADARPVQVWDPRRIAGTPLHLSDEAAADCLHETIRDCVTSWAGHVGDVVMDLSGGLDSSIVAACLASAPDTARFEIIHHRVRSGDATELAFAQATGDHLGRPVTPIDILPSRDLPNLDRHPASARPWRQFLGLGFQSLLPDRFREPGTVFFTGQGGDHLFLMTRSSLGLADCLKTGPRARLWQEWLNAARLSDMSVWQVLATNVPYLLGRPGRSLLAEALRSRADAAIRPPGLAPSDVLAGLPDWTLDPDGLPPGKFEQVSALLHMFLVRDPLAGFGGRYVLHPLISQPLIELCLRLPVWQLCLGGVNRGLARAAFAGDLPDRVRLRTTKGEATQYFIEHLSANQDRIRDALQDGAVMKAGLLTPRVLDRLLADPVLADLSSARMLLQLYGMEAWLRAVTSPN